MTVAFLQIVSQAFGWVYTLSWSLSFYPQPILNIRRRSVSGINIDFFVANVLGFLAYFISNAAFLYSPVIREQYAARNHGLTPTVRVNDLAFAGHAVLLTAISLSQFYPSIWGFDKSKKDSEANLSSTILGIIVGCILGVCTVAVVVAASPRDDPQLGLAWIDVVYAVSYVKLFITLIKYMPQVLTNYRNGSTKGWSIWQIIFDFVGGVLSIAQLGIDSYLQGDWSGIRGNPVKLALGNISIIFDLIFMFQHFVLYRRKSGKEIAEAEGEDEGGNEEEPLLGS